MSLRVVIVIFFLRVVIVIFFLRVVIVIFFNFQRHAFICMRKSVNTIFLVFTMISLRVECASALFLLVVLLCSLLDVVTSMHFFKKKSVPKLSTCPSPGVVTRGTELPSPSSSPMSVDRSPSKTEVSLSLNKKVSRSDFNIVNGTRAFFGFPALDLEALAKEVCPELTHESQFKALEEVQAYFSTQRLRAQPLQTSLSKLLAKSDLHAYLIKYYSKRSLFVTFIKAFIAQNIDIDGFPNFIRPMEVYMYEEDGDIAASDEAADFEDMMSKLHLANADVGQVDYTKVPVGSLYMQLAESSSFCRPSFDDFSVLMQILCTIKKEHPHYRPLPMIDLVSDVRLGLQTMKLHIRQSESLSVAMRSLYWTSRLPMDTLYSTMYAFLSNVSLNKVLDKFLPFVNGKSRLPAPRLTLPHFLTYILVLFCLFRPPWETLLAGHHDNGQYKR